MSPLVTTLLVCLFVVIDLAVVGAVLQAAGQTLRDFGKHFPGQPIGPDAVRKRFQSFKIGMLGLGGSIHVAADERYLHLQPAWAAAWLGMKPISIPWEAMVLKQRASRWRSASVRIGKTTLEGPDWCLSLAPTEPVVAAPASEAESGLR